MSTGLDSPFQLLVETAALNMTPTIGPGLTQDLREVFGGDWLIPDTDLGVYRYSNFVMSHDGKVSFAVEGHEGGGDVSGFNPHDQWLMGLLRARADAVMVGANTLRTEFNHLWTSEFIFPQSEPLFDALRLQEGRRQTPLQLMVTRSGKIPHRAAIFDEPGLEVIVATTVSGQAALKSHPATFDVLACGENEVDFDLLHQRLRDDYGVHTVLSEGGPSVYSALLRAGQVDEEFLTLSPILVGGSSEHYRPGLIDGWALEPGVERRSELLALRRAGDHLFLRSRPIA